jgi:histone H3/H4
LKGLVGKRALVDKEGSMADMLCVASKVKKYVKEKAGMNTSASFLTSLSAEIEKVCDQAISAARDDGRKTVKDRDIGSGGI